MSCLIIAQNYKIVKSFVRIFFAENGENARKKSSKVEIILWSVSVMVISISFCAFDRINYITLKTSLALTISILFTMIFIVL